jgi:preprotein translocase subunit SecG
MHVDTVPKMLLTTEGLFGTDSGAPVPLTRTVADTVATFFFTESIFLSHLSHGHRRSGRSQKFELPRLRLPRPTVALQCSYSYGAGSARSPAKRSLSVQECLPVFVNF